MHYYSLVTENVDSMIVPNKTAGRGGGVYVLTSWWS